MRTRLLGMTFTPTATDDQGQSMGWTFETGSAIVHPAPWEEHWPEWSATDEYHRRTRQLCRYWRFLDRVGEPRRIFPEQDVVWRCNA